jgi:hypothetical protein
MLGNVGQPQLIWCLCGEVALDEIIVHWWSGLAVLAAILSEHCSSFSGPNSTFPHPLAGCIARGEQGPGSGFTSRTVPGTETIYFTAPFLNGASLQLTNITNGAPADGTSCPADHPARVGVSGVISASEPGTRQYDGSPVSATICANATDFILATGSTFTIYKK